MAGNYPWEHNSWRSGYFPGYSFPHHGQFSFPYPAVPQTSFDTPEFDSPRPQSPSNSETSEPSSAGKTTKSKKRTPWTTTEEEILIDLCKEHRKVLKGSGSSKKWEEIAEELNRSSDEVNTSSSIKTGTQAKDKWHNLLNAYKKAKDSSTKSGEGTKKMKAFKHFDQMDMFMGDKHEIAMPFVRNSSKSSESSCVAVPSAIEVNDDSSVSSQVHSEVQVQETAKPTESEKESPKKKSKVKKGKSPKKSKDKKIKDGEDDRWYDIFEKQTKVLEASQKSQEHYFSFMKESEDRGRDLLITAIRELGTVLGGAKGKKRKAESSDEED